MNRQDITPEIVSKVAYLAHLKLTPRQLTKFSKQLSNVLEYMSKIQSLKTQSVTETSQVTGLTNIFREDVVDTKRTLTQKEALSNAKKTHNGYFVVPAIFEE